MTAPNDGGHPTTRWTPIATPRWGRGRRSPRALSTDVGAIFIPEKGLSNFMENRFLCRRALEFRGRAPGSGRDSGEIARYVAGQSYVPPQVFGRGQCIALALAVR